MAKEEKKTAPARKRPPRPKTSLKKAVRKTASSTGRSPKKTATSKVSSTRREKTRKSPEKPSFRAEIERFVNNIESLTKALETTMAAMSDLFQKSADSMDKFIDSKVVRRKEKDGSEAIRIKPPYLSQFMRHVKALSSSSLAVSNIPQIFLCSLVHKYDAYLGRLLRGAFLLKPELLSASQKSITFADLTSFRSLAAARVSIIEKEVESVIRDSHVDHFDWMEKRFGIPLRKDLAAWIDFVEITERRNLFVHCDGIVSSQYLAVCKQQGVTLKEGLKPGDQLQVDEEYFRKAFDCIFEIGVKLGHVLWRKLQTGDIKNADQALHTTGYELLAEERYALTKMLLIFATETLKKTSSDEIRRFNLINLAIAQQFSGEAGQCNELLDGEDWTACSPKFRLAVAVLKHRYAEAATIMKDIGSKGEVSRGDYSTWPLFKAFRKSKEFLDAYHRLFGEEFVLPEELDLPSKKPTKRSMRRSKPRA